MKIKQYVQEVIKGTPAEIIDRLSDYSGSEYASTIFTADVRFSVEVPKKEGE